MKRQIWIVRVETRSGSLPIYTCVQMLETPPNIATFCHFARQSKGIRFSETNYASSFRIMRSKIRNWDFLALNDLWQMPWQIAIGEL